MCAGGGCQATAAAGVAAVGALTGYILYRDEITDAFEDAYAGAVAICRPGGSGDECDEIFDGEADDCWRNYGSVFGGGSWQVRSCLKRAEDRRNLCKANGGTMPDDAPSPWSDRDIDGWPTIH